MTVAVCQSNWTDWIVVISLAVTSMSLGFSIGVNWALRREDPKP